MFYDAGAPLVEEAAGGVDVVAEGAVGQFRGEGGEGVVEPGCDGRGGEGGGGDSGGAGGGDTGEADGADGGDQLAGQDGAEGVQELAGEDRRLRGEAGVVFRAAGQ